MIVDLDVRDAQNLAKQDGGAPIGAIRGELICGLNLRSAQDCLKAAGKAGKAGKKQAKRNVAQELSCRHVVVSIVTPDLSAKHEHRLQNVTTESVDDDSSPEFRHQFHGSSGFTIYESSRSLQIEVWDTIEPKKPVQVGKACVDMECDYESAQLPEYEYLMDGDEGNYVNVSLSWQPEDKATEPVAAGAVRLSLTYIPEPDLLGAATQSVLQRCELCTAHHDRCQGSTRVSFVYVHTCALKLLNKHPKDQRLCLCFGLRIVQLVLRGHSCVHGHAADDSVGYAVPS
jgi:hypothetical protein